MLHPCIHPGCTASFDRPWKLRVHYDKHRNDKNYKCPFDNCEKAYFMSQHLQRHVSICHDKTKQRERTTCNGSGNFRRYLKRMPAYRFRCNRCQVIFDYVDAYWRHVVDDCCTTFVCRLKNCRRRYTDSKSYRTHVLEDHRNDRRDIFLCEKCSFVCDRKFLMIVHARRHLICVCDLDRCPGKLIPTLTKFLNCDRCEFICRSYPALAKHRRVKHSDVEPPQFGSIFVCDPQQNKRDASFKRHYECDSCGDTFNERRKFVSHVKICFKLPSEQFRCLRCDKLYHYRRNLNAHQQICLYDNYYVCPVLNCQKPLAATSVLKRHIILHKDKQNRSPGLSSNSGRPKISYSRKLAVKLSKDFTEN